MTQPDAVALPEEIEGALTALSKARGVNRGALLEGKNGPQVIESYGKVVRAYADLRTAIAALVQERDEALAKLARIEAQEPVAWVVYNATGDLEDVDTEFAQAADTAREWDALYPSDAPHRVVALYEREVNSE